MKNVIFAIAATLLGLNTSFAASGDIEQGKSKAAMCAACHGANGIGTTDMYPNIAGQHADYIVKQLKAFKNGDRKDPVMAPMAMGLSDEDMANIAAYFASLDRKGQNNTASSTSENDSAPAVAAAPSVYEGDAVKGKNMYELGDATRGIGACIGCHGKDGHSNVLIYPNLAKQHPEYVEKQLQNFKSGARTNYAMNQFAQAMTEDEIADIGAYITDTKAVANVKARKVVPVSPMNELAIAGKAKAAVCASCHGADGNSPVAIYPKLAGQHANYIVKQLKEFKNSTRQDPVMAGMVAALSENDMKELGAYFASQKPTIITGETNNIGKDIYFGGDASRGVTACVACHGVNGQGMESAGFPSVAHQNVDYLKGQLAKFKKSDRANDRNSMMRNIAKKLSNKDMAAVAQYMSTMK